MGCCCDDLFSLFFVVVSVHECFVCFALLGVAGEFFSLGEFFLVLVASCSTVGEFSAFDAWFAYHECSWITFLNVCAIVSQLMVVASSNALVCQ